MAHSFEVEIKKKNGILTVGYNSIGSLTEFNHMF